MSTAITLRRATMDDVATIIHQRCAMFTEMQVGTAASVARMATKYPAWLEPRLAKGEYQGWFAVQGEIICAGAGVWFMEWQPHVRDENERFAYLLNVYTELDYRRQGLARRLVEHILEDGQTQGITRFKLHASPAGEALYQSLGFARTNEMTLKITEDE